MKNIITILCISLQVSALAQFSSPQWERSIGGSQYDYTKDLEKTFDGGFITIGYTESSDGLVSSNHGSGDCWIVKFDAAGQVEWEKTFGGSGYDYGYSIIQTSDGGYAVAAYTESADGDLAMNHGGGDCWVIKIDYAGNIEWQKVFGGSLHDDAQSICQTMDGGYVIGANTESNDGDVTTSYGGGDCWVIKLNYAGMLQWQKVLGGTSYDYVQCISGVADGSFIFCGGSNSSDLDVGSQKGNGDCWAVMLSSTGSLTWEHTFGGSGYDFAQSVAQTADGNFVLAGYTDSNDGDVSGSHGGGDSWVLKFDAPGNVLWQQAFGSSGNDYAYGLQVNSDGSFLCTGYSEFNDGDVTGNHGEYDCWLMMLNPEGALLFQRSLGGSVLDAGYSVCQVSTGSFIVAGYSQSDDGDISTSFGGGDGWIVKVNTVITRVENEGRQVPVTISPNPGNGDFYFSGLKEGDVVEVSDAAGRKIQVFKTDGFNGRLEMKEESKGTYFFRVNQNDRVQSGTFIIN